MTSQLSSKLWHLQVHVTYIGVQARREVSDLVSNMVDAGGGLPPPEDRLLTIMEAAQVLHACCPPSSATTQISFH